MTGERRDPGVGIEHVTAAEGNTFADLGLPDAEERLLKADLDAAIGALIAARG